MELSGSVAWNIQGPGSIFNNKRSLLQPEIPCFWMLEMSLSRQDDFPVCAKPWAYPLTPQHLRQTKPMVDAYNISTSGLEAGKPGNSGSSFAV